MKKLIIAIFMGLFLFCFGIPEGFASKTNILTKPDGIILHSSSCGSFSGAEIAKRCHFIVYKNGKISPCVPENIVVPGIKDFIDRRSLVIVVEGDFNGKNYPDSLKTPSNLPPRQKTALVKLLFSLMAKYDIPLSQIERHMDHHRGIACPGSGFPYFSILHEMALKTIKRHNHPLLKDICQAKKIPIPLQNARILVDKDDYSLKLYAGKIFLKSYKIGLSNKPTGDKLRSGDRKTPVGSFYVCEKYPMRAWMEISYPGPRHAKIGLQKGIISQKEYERIISCHKKRGMPYHDSPMGNDVGLHAGGFPYERMRTDYTAGCIGLQDPEAFEIYSAVPLGSLIIIKEK